LGNRPWSGGVGLRAFRPATVFNAFPVGLVEWAAEQAGLQRIARGTETVLGWRLKYLYFRERQSIIRGTSGGKAGRGFHGSSTRTLCPKHVRTADRRYRRCQRLAAGAAGRRRPLVRGA